SRRFSAKAHMRCVRRAARRGCKPFDRSSIRGGNRIPAADAIFSFEEIVMKLYYSPAACSLAPHIALEESGLRYDLVKVDVRTHKLPNGTDYYTINPKGYVPLLELGDGERLTETAVILQYIADRTPGTLAPDYGTMERYRLNEWLHFIATEIHKQFG